MDEPIDADDRNLRQKMQELQELIFTRLSDLESRMATLERELQSLRHE